MMRRSILNRLFWVCVLSAIFFLSASRFSLAYEKEINSLSSTMAENIAQAGKKRIAVVDFTDLQGNVTELGRFLAEEFSVALAGAGKGFEVVDRIHLKALLREHKLSLSDLIDPQAARKLGQVAGVEALLTGTITPFGDSVRLSIKILDITTAKVIGAARGNIAKTQAIEELLARGIEFSQLFGQQTSTTSYVSYTGGAKSKKIGDIVVTMKKIVVSKGQVMVILDFFNQSDKKIKLARDKSADKPSLVDEKGNIFRYEDGLTREHYTALPKAGRGQTLTPKLNNDVTFKFSYSERDISYNDIGSAFTFSLNFLLCDSKDKSVSKHQVSFMDIKAQKPE